MKKVAIMAMAALAVFAFGGTGTYAQTSDMMMTVQLSAQNSSGQSGTAMLSDAGGGKTKVVIQLSNGTAEPQPIHFHKGTCANLDPVPVVPLNNLVNGRSETTVDAPLSTLANGTHAINAHKSAAEVSVYVSCGNVQAMMMAGGDAMGAGSSMGPMPGTGNGDQFIVLGGLALLAVGLTGAGLTLARRKA